MTCTVASQQPSQISRNWKLTDMHWTSPAFGGQIMAWQLAKLGTFKPLVLVDAGGGWRLRGGVWRCGL